MKKMPGLFYHLEESQRDFAQLKVITVKKVLIKILLSVKRHKYYKHKAFLRVDFYD